MPIYEHLSTFAGKPVVEWSAGSGITDPTGTAYRLTVSYEEDEEGTSLADKLAAFLDDPAAGRVEALVIGAWNAGDSGAAPDGLVEALAAARGRLAALRHLFFGDIICEECEISWIVQADVSPLLEAYLALESFGVRGGGEGLSFGAPRHANLRWLVVQSGGLPAGVVREVAAADLPALEHLELWLGAPGYGGDAAVDDLAPLLRAERFPRLRYLGLKNSQIADDVAAAVALAPVTERLEVLDLSMGTLGDAGARALLNSPAVRRLKKLDIRHHYVSPAVVAELKALGIDVDAGEPQEPSTWGGGEHRYVAVSE